MVKKCIFLFFSALSAFVTLQAQEVKISAAADGHNFREKTPIPGTVSVTHNQGQKVDLDSFRLGADPLKVNLIQETQVSPSQPLVVSFYKFALPGKEKGLYILPPITVTVDGKTYSSIENTYEVVASKAAPPASTAPTSVYAPSAPLPNTNATLSLVGSYDAPSTIYPGQQLKMYYRYKFNTNIELTDEKLPLLDAPGFTKIGSRDIKDTNEGDFSVREISQRVVATKPGQFNFPAAMVEGNVYRVDDYGVKQYQKPKISAESDAVTITVTAFPATGRPTSFNGAVGSFSSITDTLNSPPTVTLGDKIALDVEIFGADSETVPLPDLCCQPGFSGFFQQSDLPPIEKFSGKSKKFAVELRPLTVDIKSIPSIEFSYFDPATKTYKTLHTEPISIAVVDKPATPTLPSTSQAAPADNSWRQQSQQTIPQPVPETVGIISKDTRNFLLSTWWVLLLIPLGACLLYFQRKKVIKEQVSAVQPIKPTAELLFRAAEQEGIRSPHYYKLMTQAFLLRLVEKGEIPSTEISPDKLPTTGDAGKVRELLLAIDEKRFTGQTIDSALIERARKLFQSL